jgi:glycosyltransferase involved in cell wall biosynthesis
MPVGGAEDFALGVYPHLAPEVEARFVCLRSLDVLGQEAHAAGWPIELLPLFPTKRLSPLALWKFSRWLKYEGIDVVHSQTYHAHLFAVAAARLAGIRSVVHQQKTLGQMPLRKRILFNGCLRGADKILTLSEQTRRQICGEFGIPSDRIEVVPNAIDEATFRPSQDKPTTRKSLGLPENEILIGTVASLHPVKNHQATIEALSLLGQKGIHPKVVFVGEGVARADLERLAQARGVGEQVLFAGRRRPVAPWFQALDVFLLPSVWEGQALALLQAISCELPAIASRIEGNTAVLGDSHPGLFDPHDYKKLATLLSRVVEGGASRAAFLHDKASVPTCRAAAAHLKRIYSQLA